MLRKEREKERLIKREKKNLCCERLFRSADFALFKNPIIYCEIAFFKYFNI
jgi:hypothetical protein